MQRLRRRRAEQGPRARASEALAAAAWATEEAVLHSQRAAPPKAWQSKRVSPFLRTVLEELLRRHRASQVVDLNDVAEVIGAHAVSYDEVEALIDALEAEGMRVSEALQQAEIDLMKEVLAAARALTLSTGTRPSVDAIARQVGRPPHEVRRALEWAGRPGRASARLAPLPSKQPPSSH